MKSICVISATIGLFFWSSPVLSQNERFSIQYFHAGENRIYMAVSHDEELDCNNIDISKTTIANLLVSKQEIFAESLMYGNTVGYIYWTTQDDGSHEVFFATFEYLNCAVDETKHDDRRFSGSGRDEQARAYYMELLAKYGAQRP